MENRIKEQQLCLYRTSCATMRANQVRLYLSTVAYIVMRALREFGRKDTEMARAQCDTIRLRLLKIGAVIRVSVRRVVLSPVRGLSVPDLVHQSLRQLASTPRAAAAAGAVHRIGEDAPARVTPRTPPPFGATSADRSQVATRPAPTETGPPAASPRPPRHPLGTITRPPISHSFSGSAPQGCRAEVVRNAG